MPANTTNENCHCDECREIHSEFIDTFGSWPNMTHKGSQQLKHIREENLKSWELAVEISGDALYHRKIGE